MHSTMGRPILKVHSDLYRDLTHEFVIVKCARYGYTNAYGFSPYYLSMVHLIYRSKITNTYRASRVTLGAIAHHPDWTMEQRLDQFYKDTVDGHRLELVPTYDEALALIESYTYGSYIAEI